MARLIDKIRLHPDLFPKEWKAITGNCPVIVADNVADRVVEDGLEFDPVALPNLAPPFPFFFVEFAVPTQMREHFKRLPEYPLNMVPLRAGVLYSALSTPEDIRWFTETWKTTIDMGGGYVISRKQDENASQRSNDFKWLLLGNLIFEVGEGLSDVSKFPFQMLAILSDGAVAFGGVTLPNRVKGLNEGSAIRMAQEFNWAFNVTNFAISLMHCQNIRRISQTQPEGLDRKWRKKTGKPLSRYYILDVDHSKTDSRKAEPNLSDSKNRFHLCRGHFKTFGEKGLFGKYKGTFWWPQHARGSASEGSIEKDYRVTPEPAV